MADVMEHFSDEWIAALDRTIADHPGLAAATVGRRIVVEYTLRASRGATTDRAYALVLDDGRNRCVPGPATDPDITISTDPRTAAAIANHVESAQSAFMAGRLVLGGDVRVLMANQSVLADIDDATHALRAETTFGSAAEEPSDA